MSLKYLFFDVETTGTDPRHHGIFEMSMIADYDGKTDSITIKMRPDLDQTWEDWSLAQFNREDIEAYPLSSWEGFSQLSAFLDKHINKFDKTDKFVMIGWNVRFDEQFLRALFERHGDSYYGSYFYPIPIDGLNLTAYLTLNGILSSYKLIEAAKYLGIEVDATKMHESDYDLFLTRTIFYKILESFPPI